MFLSSTDQGMFVIVDAVKDKTLYLQSLGDLPGKNSEISSQMLLGSSLRFESFSKDENLSTR